MERDGLRECLDLIIDLEVRLRETLAPLLAATGNYLEAPGIVGALHTLVSAQGDVLQAHSQAPDTTDVPPIGSTISAALEAGQENTSGSETLAMLRAVTTRLSQTAFGYAVLHAVAHRSYDVTTANLADEHRRAYVRAIEALHRAVGDVAVDELQEAGHVCRCQCPACGPGICICWHVHADAAREEALAEGILVRAPRPRSNADRAGLRHGDVVLAVEDEIVRSYEDMRDGMGRHQPGENVHLRVRRSTGELDDVVITR